jgi:U32 family peptidase
MNKPSNKYELLSPVGNYNSLHSAIDAGADAIYFGIKGFNMREGAKNFLIKDLPKIKKICNKNPKKIKIYLTLNTIVYDNEIKKIEEIIKKSKDYVDAIICWDFAIISLCKMYKIPFHISTQASVSNIESAKFYKNLGAERIVLARELNLKQIKKISKIIDIECFTHGAMCVSYSGRCFTSQFIHNLSANRGECAHPCRREWIISDNSNNKLRLENNRVMSAKDLCTLPFIEKMKKAGIKSFKLEGRNRSPEYVHAVTRIYRKALDKKLNSKEIKESLNELNKVYNRGFSSGFYLKIPTSDDFSHTENGEQEEYKEYVARVEKYYPKKGVALIKMHAGKISINDEVYLLHKDSSLKRIRIDSIQINKKDVTSIKKGQDAGIKLPLVKKGTEIYIIKQKK